MEMEIVTLRNGLRISNFSSYHDFNFVDGCRLPGYPKEVRDKYMCDLVWSVRITERNKIQMHNTTLKVGMTDAVKKRINTFYELWRENHLDVVLIPSVMCDAMLEYLRDELSVSQIDSPFRTVRIKHNTTKTIETDRFCMC